MDIPMDSLKDDPIIIPIGDSCSVAYRLGKLGLRKVAFPFDWLRIKRLSTVTEIIRNGFVDFGKFKLVGKATNFPLLNGDTFDENGVKETFKAINGYGTISYHDFSSNFPFDNQIDEIQQKYQRRIDRFYQVLKSDKHVIFVRDELNGKKLMEKDIMEFIDCIQKINPLLRFSIKIIAHKEKIDFDIPNVSIIHDTKEFVDWTRPNVDWLSVFNA